MAVNDRETGPTEVNEGNKGIFGAAVFSCGAAPLGKGEGEPRARKPLKTVEDV